MIVRSRGVDIFSPVFLAHLQAMNPRWPHCAQELALRRKNHHAAWGVCADVKIARFIYHHAAVARPERLPARIFLEELRRDGVLQLSGAGQGGYERDDTEQHGSHSMHSFFLIWVWSNYVWSK